MALEKEFQYYIDNQETLVKKYAGKVLAIKGGVILGAFDSEIQAVKFLAPDHKLGSYLLQRCLDGKESYTRVFHSRVVFA